MLQVFIARHHLATREQLQTYKQHCLALGLKLPNGHAVRIHTDTLGKPHLSDFPNWQFNFSHSKGHVALVLGLTPFSLGIDIESYPRTIRPNLAQASLSSHEWHTYQNHPDPMRYWLQMWTVKEAVLKAAGTGIHLDMNHIDTQLSSSQNHGHMNLDNQIYTFQCWSEPDYQLSLAWKSEADLPMSHFRCQAFD